MEPTPRAIAPFTLIRLLRLGSFMLFFLDGAAYASGHPLAGDAEQQEIVAHCQELIDRPVEVHAGE
ncbi:MAG: hypothetical protein V5B40_19070 [Candidatus Accumulibacter meliphilus]|uniref:hypothetical protein n=1 Tax=Candidatus Accumulibacter meliphilus TaxID=2211374 RepID=UPI002FC2A502